MCMSVDEAWLSVGVENAIHRGKIYNGWHVSREVRVRGARQPPSARTH